MANDSRTKTVTVPGGAFVVRPLTSARVAEAAAILEAEKIKVGGEDATLSANLRLQTEAARIVLVSLKDPEGTDILAGLDASGVKTLLAEEPGLLTAISDAAKEFADELAKRWGVVRKN